MDISSILECTEFPLCYNLHLYEVFKILIITSQKQKNKLKWLIFLKCNVMVKTCNLPTYKLTFTFMWDFFTEFQSFNAENNNVFWGRGILCHNIFIVESFSLFNMLAYIFDFQPFQLL